MDKSAGGGVEGHATGTGVAGCLMVPVVQGRKRQCLNGD